MDQNNFQNFQASFVPKKPIVAGPSSVVSSGGGISIFTIIALIFVIVALGSAGAVYYFEKSYTKGIEDNKATLEKAKDEFEPELIKSLVRMSDRIETSKQLLGEHYLVTPIFSIINDATLRSVRFKSFSFSNSAGKISVSMKGVADSFMSVALQSEVFAQSKYIKSPVVGDLSLDQSGNVLFNFTASFNTDALSYDKKDTNNAAASIEAIQ